MTRRAFVALLTAALAGIAAPVTAAAAAGRRPMIPAGFHGGFHSGFAERKTPR